MGAVRALARMLDTAVYSSETNKKSANHVKRYFNVTVRSHGVNTRGGINKKQKQKQTNKLTNEHSLG